MASRKAEGVREMEKPHKKLDVWQAAMKLARQIYVLSNRLPVDEKFGFVSQMRRSVVSIPCNIAEGAARQGKKEFRNFLSMAQGSLSELDTQLDLAKSLNYFNEYDIRETDDLLLRIDKMLSGLIHSLQRNDKNNKLKQIRFND